ncbi:MAG: glycerol-3-phosphate acyltransferase, partial [Candidatus Omnitrophica bacterium]|nr:glycerol-3-phosphate acyltransferase [Candidatus Omnitrophota bacterium]
FFQGLIPETLAIVSRLLFGVSCIIGRNWTIFLQFKGGKGVASTLGVLIGLAATIPGLYIVLLLVLATWGLVFLFSRIVSLASILAGISMPFYMWFFKQTPVIIVAGAALAVLGILRHKTNLKRIFLGTEPKLSFKKK